MDTPTTTPVSSPNYVPPPIISSRPPSSHVKQRALIVGAVLLVLIIIAVASMPGVRASFALRGIELAQADYGTTPVWKFGWSGGLKDASVRAGEGLSDYAKAGSHEVAIAADPSGVGQVMLLGRTPRTLTSDVSTKAAVAIDPSGTHVAYAAHAQGTEFSSNIADWTVQLLDLVDGKTVDLGTGFAPAFFEKDGKAYLMFSVPGGVTFLDLGTLTAITIPSGNFSNVIFAATVSPDGRYLATRNVFTGAYDLHALESGEGGFRLTAMGSTAPGLSDIAWKRDTLYGVRVPAEGNVDIVSIPTEDPTATRIIYTFASDTTYRLIP